MIDNSNTGTMKQILEGLDSAQQSVNQMSSTHKMGKSTATKHPASKYLVGGEHDEEHNLKPWEKDEEIIPNDEWDDNWHHNMNKDAQLDEMDIEEDILNAEKLSFKDVFKSVEEAEDNRVLDLERELKAKMEADLTPEPFANDIKEGDTVTIHSAIDSHNGEQGTVVEVRKQGMVDSFISGDKIIYKVQVQDGKVYAYGANELEVSVTEQIVDEGEPQLWRKAQQLQQAIKSELVDLRSRVNGIATGKATSEQIEYMQEIHTAVLELQRLADSAANEYGADGEWGI